MIDPTELARIRALHEEAEAELQRLCESPREFRMTIPADEDRDSDLILGAALREIPALLDAAERLGEAEDALRAVAEYGENTYGGCWCDAFDIGMRAETSHSVGCRKARAYFKRREEEGSDA